MGIKSGYPEKVSSTENWCIFFSYHEAMLSIILSLHSFSILDRTSYICLLYEIYSRIFLEEFLCSIYKKCSRIFLEGFLRSIINFHPISLFSFLGPI